MKKVSKRQEDILAFIKEEVRAKGYPPSVREIGEAVGLASSSTVHGHLARLEQKGFIRRDPTKPRAIEILEPEESIQKQQVIHVHLSGRLQLVLQLQQLKTLKNTSHYPIRMAQVKINCSC